MSNRQGGGQRGTTYIGTKATQPPEVHIRKRNPDQYDTNGYSIMDLWLNEDALEIWILVSLEGTSTSKGQLATWIQFGGGGSAITFVANTGNATEAGGFLNVLGVSDANNNTGARTNAAGNTINIEITPVSFDGDAGTATPSNDTINILGGSGITTSAAGNTVTITAASGISSVPTDSGTAVPAGGVLQIKTNLLTKEAGSTVFFRGAGNEVILEVTDPDANTIIGDGAGSLTATGLANTVLGDTSVPTLTSGSFNTVVGAISGILTSGSRNTFIGEEVGGAITTGSDSIMIGRRAGNACTTGTESSNIYIGNLVGVDNESNTIRVGVQGNGAGQQNAAYMAGVYGASTSGGEQYVQVGTDGKLSSTVVNPGGLVFIETIDANNSPEIVFDNLGAYQTYEIVWSNVTILLAGSTDVGAITLQSSDDNGASWNLVAINGLDNTGFSAVQDALPAVPISTYAPNKYPACGRMTVFGINNSSAGSFGLEGKSRSQTGGATPFWKYNYYFGGPANINRSLVINALRFIPDLISYPTNRIVTGKFSLYGYVQ